MEQRDYKNLKRAILLSSVVVSIICCFIAPDTTAIIMGPFIVQLIMISVFYLIDRHEKRFLLNEYLNENNYNTQEYHKITGRQREEIQSLIDKMEKVKQACLIIEDVDRINGLKAGDVLEITDSKYVETGTYKVIENRLASVLFNKVTDLHEETKIEYPKIFLGAKETKIIKIV